MAPQGHSYIWKKLGQETIDKGWQKGQAPAAFTHKHRRPLWNCLGHNSSERLALIAARKHMGKVTSHCQEVLVHPQSSGHASVEPSIHAVWLLQHLHSMLHTPTSLSVIALPCICCSRFHFQYSQTFPLFFLGNTS